MENFKKLEFVLSVRNKDLQLDVVDDTGVLVVFYLQKVVVELFLENAFEVFDAEGHVPSWRLAKLGVLDKSFPELDSEL